MTEPRPCSQCGTVLDPSVSEQMAQLLHLESWPCPSCDLNSPSLITAEADLGILVEQAPIAIGVRPADSGFQLILGLGSEDTDALSMGIFSGGSEVLKEIRLWVKLAKISPDTIPAQIERQKMILRQHKAE